LLFPCDEPTQQRLTKLEEWFQLPNDQRGGSGPVTWLEATALAFGATNADDLPTLVDRVFDLRHLEVAGEAMWKFTAPLLYRLGTDPDAVQVLIDSLDGRPPTGTSSLFAPQVASPMLSAPMGDVARRVFITARILKAAGHLTGTHLGTGMRVLQTADPRLSVADPFAETTGPLYTLGARLADG
jgi:hypothetical protein